MAKATKYYVNEDGKAREATPEEVEFILTIQAQDVPVIPKPEAAE